MAEKKQQATHKPASPKPNAPQEEKDRFIEILDRNIEDLEREIKEEDVV